MRRILTIATIALTTSALLYVTTMNNTDTESVPPHVVEAFNKWKLAHGNLYFSPSEHNYRLQIFNKKYRLIQEINNQNLRWKAGINEFTGLTEEEFATKYLGGFEDQLEENQIYLKAPKSLQAPPDSIDWTDKNILTNEVQYQQKCGGCWAFTSASIAEASYNIIKKPETPRKFSEQQLIDCSKRNWGCKGGWPKMAYSYMIQISGMADLSDYPFEGKQGQCRISGKKITKKFDRWYLVESTVEDLKNALVKQPVAAALSVNQNFAVYKSGIFDDPECVTKKIALHTMTLVGYKSGPNGYWRLKNQWGKVWGDQGYMNIAMVDDKKGKGICNIHQSATYIVYE